MTITRRIEPLLQPGRPNDLERRAADQLRAILSAQRADAGAPLTLTTATGSAEIVLPPGLTDLLLEVLRPLARGEAVTLVPVSQMLTTQQAADLLNVSRPYLIKLLEQGDINFELVNRHRRIRADDLFKYIAKRDADRAAALDELIASDADLL